MHKNSVALKYDITYAKNQCLYLILPIANGILKNKQKQSIQLMVKKLNTE